MRLRWRVICAGVLVALYSAPDPGVARAGQRARATKRADWSPVVRLGMFTSGARAPSEVRERERTQRCVATKIAAHWALTASHCVPEAPGQHVFERHPTHDVALVRLSEPEFRALPPMQLSAAAPPSEHTYALRLPDEREGTSRDAASGLVLTFFRASQAAQLALRETSRTPHVLRLHSEAPCLEPGDSGTPVVSAGAIVGVLIGGSPRCPGTQTVVRLESLLPWLLSRITDREGEHARP